MKNTGHATKTHVASPPEVSDDQDSQSPSPITTSSQPGPSTSQAKTSKGKRHLRRTRAVNQSDDGNSLYLLAENQYINDSSHSTHIQLQNPWRFNIALERDREGGYKSLKSCGGRKKSE